MKKGEPSMSFSASTIRSSTRLGWLPYLLLAAAIAISGATPAGVGRAATGSQEGGALDQINHIVVIYQENHSFDNYLGTFPGADGIANAGAAAVQVDRSGQAYAGLPVPLANPVDNVRRPHPAFPDALPNRPFLMNEYVTPEDETANLIHAYYRQQYQIADGQMNRFVAWSDAGGLPMGYWDLAGLPLYELGREFTVADHFFQAALGGSFLNHQWLVCACKPTFPDAPAAMVSAPFADDPEHMDDRQLSSDGHVVNHDSANPSYSVNSPHPANARPDFLVPQQTAPTIGDRLDEAGIDWAWYSGGWD